MLDLKLGKMVYLNLKDVWPLEEKDFTPWLANNLYYLEECLGLDLEFLDIEHRTGAGYRHADLLVETCSGDVVVIENQYGKADPSHGWRSLSYCISLNAKAVVWVFEKISVDDQNLIRFLNQKCKDLSVIAVEANVFKIQDDNGETSPSLKLEVLDCSEDALKELQFVATASKDLTERENSYGSFFPDLIASVKERIPALSPSYGNRKGKWNYYCTWNSILGCRNPWGAEFNQKKSGDGKFYLQLRFSGEDCVEKFNYISENYSSLVKDISEKFKIEWDFDDKRKSQKVKFIYPNIVDVTSMPTSQKNDIINWTMEILSKLDSNLTNLVNKDRFSNRAQYFV
jgi:hypothetical protein